MECLMLKKSDCRNCYKCIRHCAVKSIRFSGSQAYIIDNECILCGQCFVVCPQNARQIVDETEKAKVLLQSESPVVASIAPSFIAYFDGIGIESMRTALKKLGFYDAEETAVGATIVKKEYDRICNEEHRDIVITSCCHSVNLLIQKHYPEMLRYLADVISPMQAHCLDIKKRIPDAKTVFIGPCIAKKDEAQSYEGIVDAVLTFDELAAWFAEEGVEPEIKGDSEENSKARLFPTAGGILKTMALANPNYTYMAIDGVQNCIDALQDIKNGMTHNCFIEMSACTGSCIGGPVMQKYHHLPVKSFAAVSRYAGEKDFPVKQPDKAMIRKAFPDLDPKPIQPGEPEIKAVLHQMGKYKPEDELNCCSCGYDSCRAKAIAILQGKADVSMCLPYLMAKAQSFSDIIARNSTSGIIILNEGLEIQQINKAALKILNLRRSSDVLGDHIVRIMDPKDFQVVLTGKGSVQNKREYMAEYEKYVDKTILFDKEYRLLLCVLTDVTIEESQRAQKEEIIRRTAEITDQVVDKQMRVVQEIASLLGETTAETQIALKKLKESISHE